jgi:hypothetical protein
MTVAGLATLVISSAVPPAQADRPQARCGFGFELMTIGQTLVLVSDGSPNPKDVLLAHLQGLDKNGDNLVCVKDLPDTPGSPSFVRNVVDNTANTPG